LRAAARWAQQWNAITESPEQWLGLKEILHGHCADLGRDPAEITCSVNVRLDRDPDSGRSLAIALDDVAAYRQAGVDLVIMNLPLAADPNSLRPLADALTPLA